jgi:uncharacterized protein YjbI with pentapeptide repeats/uncharacterized protein (DUF1778 family)
MSAEPLETENKKATTEEVVFGFVTANLAEPTTTTVEEGISVLTSEGSDFQFNRLYCVDSSLDLGRAKSIREILTSSQDFDPDRSLCIVPNDEQILSTCRQELTELGVQVKTLVSYLDWHLRPEIVLHQLETGIDRAGNSVLRGAGSEDLLSDNFIPPRALQESTGEVKTQLISHLTEEWAQGDGLRFVVIHAPAGFGKSMFSHQLAKALARSYASHKEWEKPPLPFLIAFGNFRRGASAFNGLVMDRLQRDGIPRLTGDGFKELVRQRRINLILDGFDEMIESNAEIARSNIQDFVQNAGPQARIVLTSRSTFFKTRGDVEEQLGSLSLNMDEIEVLELLKFTDEQINQYVFKAIPNHQSAEKIARRVRDGAEFSDFAKSPLILKEIVKIESEERLSSSELGRKNIVDVLVGKTLLREQERKDFDLTEQEQLLFLEAVSLELLTSKSPGIDSDDVGLLAEMYIPRISESDESETLLGRLKNHYYLTNASGAGGLLSMHILWREYFQARGLLRMLVSRPQRVVDFQKALSKKLVATPLLRQVSQLVRPYLLNLNFSNFTSEFYNNWLRLAIESSHNKGDLQNLAAKVGGFAGKQLVDLEIVGADLSGFNFSGSTFENCQFTNCNLRAIEFSNSTLQGVVIRDCQLDNNIKAASPIGLSINGVDLSHKRLLNDLRIEGDAQVLIAVTSTESPDERSLDELFHSRLSLFVQTAPEGVRPMLRGNVKGTALVRGEDQRYNSVIRRTIVPAMKNAGLIEQVKSNDIYRVCPDAREEVVDFLHTGKSGLRVSKALSVIRRDQK